MHNPKIDLVLSQHGLNREALEIWVRSKQLDNGVLTHAAIGALYDLIQVVESDGA